MNFFSDINNIYRHRNIIAEYEKELIDLHSYMPEYFICEEFVDPEMFHKCNKKSLEFISPRILITADSIREYFGKKMTINDWKFGGHRMWSGLRTPSSFYYSPTSQHNFGNAIDFLIDGIDSIEIRNEIILNQKHFAFKYITRMEDFKNMSWIHIDCANIKNNKIKIVGK